MSGSPRSGRIRKPIELHLISGSYRRDRHGEKPADVEPPVPIVKPAGLSPEASATWDTLAEQLRLVLRPSDATALAMLAEFVCLYRKALKAAQKKPASKDARIAVVSYAATFDRLAARFGMTPSDRQRIPEAQKPAEPDEFEQFLAKGRLHNQRERARRK